MGMRNSITWSYEKVNDVPLGEIVPNAEDFDSWKINMTFKDKNIEFAYMTRKVDFTEPVLDAILNTMFNTCYIYHRYKDDYFSFLRHTGHGFKTADRANRFYEQLKGQYEMLQELFGIHYDKYDRYFRSLLNVEELVENSFKVDEVLDNLSILLKRDDFT